MKVAFVDLSRQFISNEEEYVKIFRQVGRSGQFIQGNVVEDFEKKIAAFCGTKFGLGVANGTDGLELILKAMGIGAGDEVITAPNSYIASAGAIASVGAKIVFADVNRDLNLNPVEVEKKITAKTRAIIAVHLTGRVADMNSISAIAKSYSLKLIEDAAQAIGAEYHGQRAGSFGDAASFSLHPLKNLNVLGDGGFVSTSCDLLHDKIKRLRNHGLIDRDNCEEWGNNSRLDAIQAGIASFNLEQLPSWTEGFREIARIYSEELADVVEVPQEQEFERNVYHNYVIYAERRDELMHYLATKGVETKIHYPVLLHKQRAFLPIMQGEECYPMAEYLRDRMMSLPIYPFLEREEILYVSEQIKNFYHSNN